MPTPDNTFTPNAAATVAPAIDVQILAELYVISTLLQQGFNLPDDRLLTLRQEFFQMIPVVR